MLIFALCTTFMEGAGLIGATVFGMALTNLHVPGMAQLRRVKEALVSLVVAVLFILMTADLQRDVLTRLSFSIVALMLTVLFVVRPVAILLSTIRFDLTWQERLFVAAAVAGARPRPDIIK
ncbi:MAG: cation:proton antiporter [Acetobacteraceae bacterium]